MTRTEMLNAVAKHQFHAALAPIMDKMITAAGIGRLAAPFSAAFLPMESQYVAMFTAAADAVLTDEEVLATYETNMNPALWSASAKLAGPEFEAIMGTLFSAAAAQVERGMKS